MRWNAYLDTDSVFLAQDEEVMVYRTAGGIGVLEFSGQDVTITSYPDVAAFVDAMKVKHVALATRLPVAMRQLTRRDDAVPRSALQA